MEWQLCNYKLVLPLSHRLPLFLHSYPNYSMNFGRIAAQIERKYVDIRVIDIGANIGDSVAILRAHTNAPVLCIEGDRRYAVLLRVNTAQFLDVAIVEALLGEQSGTVSATLQASLGTGSLQGKGELNGTVRLQSLTELLSQHPTFASARLLKIDTDGYDAKILRGAREFLASTAPVVFFEYDPSLWALQGECGERIFGMLEELGYRYCLAFSNTGLLRRSLGCSEARTPVELDRVIEEEHWAYLDVCVFHASDSDVFELLRESEEAVLARTFQSDARVGSLG